MKEVYFYLALWLPIAIAVLISAILYFFVLDEW